MNIRRTLFLSLVIALTSAGCHRKPAPPAEPNASATQLSSAHDSTVVPTGPLSVAIRLTHTDSTLADSLHPFHVRDTVHAVIHTENATDTSALDGKWVFLPKHAVIAENKASLAAGTNDTHFDLMNANPWPAGRYQLIVTVDQHVSDTVNFGIR